jgi:hypothetical protein
MEEAYRSSVARDLPPYRGGDLHLLRPPFVPLMLSLDQNDRSIEVSSTFALPCSVPGGGLEGVPMPPLPLLAVALRSTQSE